MDHKVLQFDRFTLDLTRGCLRQADQDIPLRPKTFEVLCHLAQNSGQLVSKQELLETVWPRVVVSDDSLTQCIRELRQRLGRDGHRLIKTVPRRGYLLDAAPAPAGLGSALAKTASGSFELSRVAAGSLKVWAGILKGLKAQPRRLWGAVAGVVCLALSIGYLLTPNGAVASSELFTKVDKERLATVAASKRLPLPSFEIAKPDESGPTEARSFVGVWVSEKGWVGSNRQLLLIVTSAANGMVAGYVVHGPAQPKSPIQSPAHFRTFKANRTGASFSYSDPSGVYAASLISDDRIEFRVEYRDGHVGFVDLYPFWTLAAAERRAQASVGFANGGS